MVKFLVERGGNNIFKVSSIGAERKKVSEESVCMWCERVERVQYKISLKDRKIIE